MKLITLKEIEEYERLLRSPNTGQSHRQGIMQYLNDLRHDKESQKESGVDQLIDKLLTEFDEYGYPLSHP